MTVTILTGDCRDVLRTLPDRSVHCCVTSPPYFGLRDYGTATWDGGRDPTCDHLSPAAHGYTPFETSTLGPKRDGINPNNSAHGDGVKRQQFRDECRKCGALRVDSQMGLEPTPDAFVAQLVVVFQEVRRVLRDDGTLWLNLGDSYASGGRKSRDPGRSKKHPSFDGDNFADGLRPVDPHGVKPKDLLGIPWMVAFAMRADGWYLRQDIIWSKPNPMPESVRDRCTKAHEYIFLLSKSEKYFFDVDAIKEPCTSYDRRPIFPGGSYVNNRTFNNADGGKSTVVGNVRTDRPAGGLKAYETRNKRSVWSVGSKPFKEAHFATFPPSLIEPCILAGCPIGGTVLDPFGGAGTTAMVAQQHGRHAIMIELNPDYAAMAQRRVGVSEPMPPIPPRQRRPWRIHRSQPDLFDGV